MCGRFLLAVEPAELQYAFPGFSFPQNLRPRYNVAPTQPALVIANDQLSRADFFLWGLIPSWAKDSTIGSRLINARAETLAEKPSFRNSYKNRRCLVISNGFYEWKQHTSGKGKTPYHIRMKNGKPFAFAGLWDVWRSPDGNEIKSFTIITTQPNELVGSIHTRMPVILPVEVLPIWLNPSPQKPEELQKFMVPFPSTEMLATPISSYVNNPANDGPECITEYANPIPGLN